MPRIKLSDESPLKRLNRMLTKIMATGNNAKALAQYKAAVAFAGIHSLRRFLPPPDNIDVAPPTEAEWNAPMVPPPPPPPDPWVNKAKESEKQTSQAGGSFMGRVRGNQ